MLHLRAFFNSVLSRQSKPVLRDLDLVYPARRLEMLGIYTYIVCKAVMNFIARVHLLELHRCGFTSRRFSLAWWFQVNARSDAIASNTSMNR